MTREERNLLIQDLCARLPYKVKCSTPYGIEVLDSIDMEHMDLTFESSDDNYYTLDRNIKPYLRPMSSMTEEEEDEYELVCRKSITTQIDWLNKNMFDYRGLIEKGLALEAPEGMYNS